MSLRISPARCAGLLYLIVIANGIFSLGYVAEQTMVKGEDAATIARIGAVEGLYRAGLAAAMVCYLAYLLLPLALYRVFATVHRPAAQLMVLFAVSGAVLSLAALAPEHDLLWLIDAAGQAWEQPAAPLETAVASSLAHYRSGVLLAEIFWGLWLFPLGYQVFRSGLAPRVLGVFLMLGGCGFLCEAFGITLFAGYAQTTLASYATTPSSIGEIALCLWLVAFGVTPMPSA